MQENMAATVVGRHQKSIAEPMPRLWNCNFEPDASMAARLWVAGCRNGSPVNDLHSRHVAKMIGPERIALFACCRNDLPTAELHSFRVAETACPTANCTCRVCTPSGFRPAFLSPRSSACAFSIARDQVRAASYKNLARALVFQYAHDHSTSHD